MAARCWRNSRTAVGYGLVSRRVHRKENKLTLTVDVSSSVIAMCESTECVDLAGWVRAFSDRPGSKHEL